MSGDVIYSYIELTDPENMGIAAGILVLAHFSAEI
jgi:hypothetical protein